MVLVGAGRVGTAVSVLLARRGHRIVGVTSRTTASAERAAERLNSSAFALEGREVPDCDVILIGATEQALPEVVLTLAPVVRPNIVIWHVVGSLGIEPLSGLIEEGCLGCAVHPLQACPSVDSAISNLPGSSWGVTTSSDIRDWAHRLVREELDGVPVDVAEKDRVLWHAASITTSTGISAVMALGESILNEIGMRNPHEALRPLVEGTVRNAFEGGGGTHTVTGPVVRGEGHTLSGHLEALSSIDASLARDYCAVARLVLERAFEAGRVDRPLYDSVGRWLHEAGAGYPDQETPP